MKNLVIGVAVNAPNSRGSLDLIVAAEQAGIDCAWMAAGLVAPDPLAIHAAAAMRTQRILLGTSIMPTFPRHPLALVQSAIAVDDFAPGRLRLGVGPSHAPVMKGVFGFPFEKPLHHLREYLAVLRAALGEGKVDFSGQQLTARAPVGEPRKIAIMASALRHNAFKLCGELADGAISWVCPLPYLRNTAVPALKEGARQVGRAVPPLVAHVPVVASTDRAKVHALAAQMFAIYPTMPFYAQMFEDAGFPEAKGGKLSERMIDALIVHGSAEQVKERLSALPSFGVQELLATPVVAPDDAAGIRDLFTALGPLASA
jgi:F420-dependent oxidoreductase-like protein